LLKLYWCQHSLLKYIFQYFYVKQHYSQYKFQNLVVTMMQVALTTTTTTLYVS